MNRPARWSVADSCSVLRRFRTPGCNAPEMAATSTGMLRAIASPHRVRGSAAQLVGQQTTRLTAGDRTGATAPRPEDSVRSARVAALRHLPGSRVHSPVVGVREGPST
jgi:hypothetical protein